MAHKNFPSICQTTILLKGILIVLACPIHSQYYYNQQYQHYPFPPRMTMTPPPRHVRQTPYYLDVNSQRYLAVPGRVLQHYNTAPLQYTTTTANFPARNSNPPLRSKNIPMRNPNIPLRNPNIPLRNPNIPLRNPNIPLRNPNIPLRNPNIPLGVPNILLRNPSVPVFSNTPLLLQSYYELEADPSSSNPDQEQENGGEDEPPPPEAEQEQSPPPENEQELSPPPENEQEEPPPMMMMTTEKPPPSENNDNNNDDYDSGNDDGGNEDHGNENDDDDPPPRPPHSHGKGKLVQKHISIHLPPPDMELDEPTTHVIRPKIPGPQKHLNIIFIKAPSKKSKKKTEVIIPNQPEQKTLVYVLVKKNDPANDGSVKVRGPAPTKPPKPSVFFIRYKQKKKHNHHHHYHH